ncbi:UNVERIFIED_CONTAM: hypothetical protein K2H54_044059 [Gekko kuhli]
MAQKRRTGPKLELTADQKQQMREAFDLLDADGAGTIDVKDLKNLKQIASEIGETLMDEELQEMIDEADVDGDGEVNEQEFLKILKKVNN